MQKSIFPSLMVLLAAGVALLAQNREAANEEKKRTLLENDRVLVREVLIEPGIQYSLHTHRYPHVGVIVKGGKLEFTEGGKKETVDLETGSAGWRDAGVTHATRNLSALTVHVIEIELKK